MKEGTRKKQISNEIEEVGTPSRAKGGERSWECWEGTKPEGRKARGVWPGEEWAQSCW